VSNLKVDEEEKKAPFLEEVLTEPNMMRGEFSIETNLLRDRRLTIESENVDDEEGIQNIPLYLESKNETGLLNKSNEVKLFEARSSF